VITLANVCPSRSNAVASVAPVVTASRTRRTSRDLTHARYQPVATRIVGRNFYPTRVRVAARLMALFDQAVDAALGIESVGTR